jgi:hypothetical protein
VKRRSPKANSLFPLSFFFDCSICSSPKQRKNTPIRFTPAACPLHNNFHCYLRLLVDCCVCSPNVISMKPSTSRITLLHMDQLLLFSLCVKMPASCLPLALPVFSPLPLIIHPDWLLPCCLRLSSCHWAGNDAPIGLTGDGGASAFGDNFFYYHAGTAKIGRTAQPQQPRHNTGSTRTLGCLLGEGAHKQRGGINVIGGWVMREAMHTRKICLFLTHPACCYAHVLGMKKTKSKIGWCSGIGKFYPLLLHCQN